MALRQQEQFRDLTRNILQMLGSVDVNHRRCAQPAAQDPPHFNAANAGNDVRALVCPELGSVLKVWHAAVKQQTGIAGDRPKQLVRKHTLLHLENVPTPDAAPLVEMCMLRNGGVPRLQTPGAHRLGSMLA